MITFANMDYGICLLSIVPCRKEPSGTSEMVTQLLFGEHYTVEEKKQDWLKILTAYDNYSCWINVRQHTAISQKTFQHLKKNKAPYVNKITQSLENKLTQSLLHLTFGASLPFLNNKTIGFESFIFGFEGTCDTVKEKKNVSEIMATAKNFINVPYLWGGRTPFGMDCSGFVQLVYKANGYHLPRDAWQQSQKGQTLDFVEEADAGDLAFFDNEEGKIVHVGILLNNHNIIHASGYVHIDHFDHYGIFDSKLGKYTHTLRVLKRVI